MSDVGQVSARPQASAQPVAALASVPLSHSVQRRSASASTTASLIRSSRPTVLITPVQTSSGGKSHISYLSLCGTLLESHTKYHNTLPAPQLLNLMSIVTTAKTALPTEFDDVGFNNIVAPNGTSSSTPHASGSFLPLAVHGRFLNGTGARTTFDTRYTAMATVRAPSGGLGDNNTSDPSNFHRSRPSQSLRPTSPAKASKTIYGSFDTYPNRTTGRLLLLPTGRPAGGSGSRSKNSSSTSSVVALPSIVVLPPYHNATSNINGSDATEILPSTYDGIGFGYPVPTTINYDFRR